MAGEKRSLEGTLLTSDERRGYNEAEKGDYRQSRRYGETTKPKKSNCR